MIIHSTVLSTQALVINVYGGTTWISHSGYLLRGATSGVTTNTASKTGGADSVSYTPAGSNAGTAISVDQMPSHNHGGNTGEAAQYLTAPQGSGTYSGVQISLNSMYNGNGGTPFAGGYPATKHKHTITAQGGGKTHTHTFSGTTATINTLPQYKSVYIWERTV